MAESCWSLSIWTNYIVVVLVGSEGASKLFLGFWILWIRCIRYQINAIVFSSDYINLCILACGENILTTTKA